MRIGLAAARGLALSLGIDGAGVSTLAALAAGAPGALPVIDAKRQRGLRLVDGEPAVLAPEDLHVAGAACVGDGAVRYRALLEERAASSRPTATSATCPRALPRRARGRAGDVDEIEPLYLRVPDARGRA